MCIRMLQVLSTGRIYNKSELADLLGTKERKLLRSIEIKIIILDSLIYHVSKRG